MVIEVGEAFTQYNFREFAKNYIDTLKLQFVKTAQEIKEDEFINSLDYIEYLDPSDPDYIDYPDINETSSEEDTNIS